MKEKLIEMMDEASAQLSKFISANKDKCGDIEALGVHLLTGGVIRSALLEMMETQRDSFIEEQAQEWCQISQDIINQGGV